MDLKKPTGSDQRTPTNDVPRVSEPEISNSRVEEDVAPSSDDLPSASLAQSDYMPAPSGMIRVTKTELVWSGKYNENGNRKETPRVNLPFQVIERINESRTSREVKKTPKTLSLFDVYEGKEGDTSEQGWRNKLVWGENSLVMSSMLRNFAGRINLIYADPPFLTQADFSFIAPIGENSLTVAKEASLIEETAYRDTWGRGLESYMGMLRPRLEIMWEMVTDSGNIFIHIGPNLCHYVRALCDEIFGSRNFQNEIVWQRHDPHNDARLKLGSITDRILWFGKGDRPYYDSEIEREELSAAAEAEFSLLELENGTVINWKGNEHRKGRRFKLDDATWKGTNPSRKFAWRGAMPSAKREWMYDSVRAMDEALAKGELYLRDPNRGAARCRKRYLDENKGIFLQDIWTNVGRMKGGSEYPTQKPQGLLDRIVRIACPPGGLIGDFFAGSGTAAVSAESNNRRWIACDLSRFGIHLTRKRLLELENCRPFEILNLGKYERQYWQLMSFSNDKALVEQSFIEYLAFVLRLYGAQPVSGMRSIHGKKGRALVHIGSVESPVTISEIMAAAQETMDLRQAELHVLGWEWEMGIYDLMISEAKKIGVKLLLLQIPREVMEQQAVEKGDIQFFQLAYLQVDIRNPKPRAVTVSLKDFVIENTELIKEEIRSKIKKWSDYIDYWAVDWDFQNDTFMQGWVTYRTRKDRTLALTSDPHTYEKPGKYKIVVKVIDIFGNDTSQAFDFEVK